MTKEEFLNKHKEKLKYYRMIGGIVGRKEDRDKANFNGVYVLIERNQAIYIGGAHPKNFTIGDRLYICITALIHQAAVFAQILIARHFNDHFAVV